MPDAGWWEALWSDPASVLAAVDLRPGMRVVDLCSGDGWFTFQIARISTHVLSIDIDGSLLEVARKRLAEANLRNVSFIEADAYDLASIVREPVDHVFLANAFHGVPDRPRLSEAVRQTLIVGGVFSVVNWHSRPREETPVLGEPRGPATEMRIEPDVTIDAVTRGGLLLRKVVEIPPYHYGAVFERPD